MDQAGTAESDAHVEPVLRDGVRREPNRAGEIAAAAAQGSVVSGGGHDTLSGNEETTPLLRKNSKSLDVSEHDQPGAGGDADVTTSWQDFEGLPWWETPSIFWILPIFFLTALSFGGIMVPRINLILELICRGYVSEMAHVNPGLTIAPVIHGQENPQCRIPEVQSRVAQFNLISSVIPGTLSAFVSPKLGALSDRYGRKPILALTGLGGFVTETLFIIAAKNPDGFPLWSILIAYALDGLCGSFTTSMALIHAYVTDCTPLHNRSVFFGYIHSCLFVGIAVGPILAGYIIKFTGGPVAVFIAGLASHVFFLTILFTVVPESLSKRRQLVARAKHRRLVEELGPAADWINRMRSINLFAPLKILWPTGPGSSPAVRRNMLLLSAIDTIVFGVAMGTFQVIVIYLDFAFGWGNFETTRFISLVNVFRFFFLVVVLPLVSRLLRGRASSSSSSGDPTAGSHGASTFDVVLLRIALVFDTAGYLGYALARTGSLFVLFGVIASVGAVGSPTLQSALTKHVGADRTGQILGAQGLLHALARVGGPLVFSAIYAATVGRFPQAVFVCLTATFGAAAVATWFVRAHVYVDESVEDETTSGTDESTSPADLNPSLYRAGSVGVQATD